ncbi:MAG TPA: penicillin-binding protein 2 [Micromonosporaceae bacterium]|nr:penicillin-binding protein 2 [Micromonosporaceae bacterium]
MAGKPDPDGRRQAGRAETGAKVVPLRSALSQARRYTPRGRSVREAAQARTGRAADPFRPALEVVAAGRGAGDSGRQAATPGRRAAASGRGTAGSGRGTAGSARGAAGSGRGSAGSGRGAAGRQGRAAALGSGRAAASAVRLGELLPGQAPRRGAGGRGTGTGRPGRPARRVSRRPVRPPRLGEPKRRLRVATVLVFALFAVIGLRLVQLQVTDASTYAARGLADRLHTVPIAAPRGAIYDRSGAVLARSVEARYVYADPSMIDNPAEAAAKLSPLLAIPPSELLPKLLPHNRTDGRPSQFEWLARSVDIATGDAVKALNIKGIGVRRDERRELPGHDLAANLLGFTGDDLHGLAGLEARYDDVLAGVNGERTYEIGVGDLAKEIPGGYRRETPAQRGSSLQLTIDRDLQYEVQHVLSAQMRTVNATFAAAVVLDVRTGEVLAQASYPPYDAADPFKVPPSQRGDAATGIVVDPGSVHKAVVLGAALQEGVVRPDSTVVVDPTIRKGDTTFSDVHPNPPGARMTLPGILAYSSNVGTIRIADALTPRKLYEYQLRFGLGVPTGVGLPGEAEGLVQPPENWSGSSYGSIPVGHGVSVTPLQMAAAYAAIANNGVWVQPHLVRATIKPGGEVVNAAAPATRRVLSPGNAAALREMLEAVVVVPDATGTAAAVAGYRVAGKTGTGQRVENGRYVSGEVASFIGMAPADAPQYVIAVFAHTAAGNGGTVAGPAFRQMMQFALQHYRVPPTGTRPPRFAVYK